METQRQSFGLFGHKVITIIKCLFEKWQNFSTKRKKNLINWKKKETSTMTLSIENKTGYHEMAQTAQTQILILRDMDFWNL